MIFIVGVGRSGTSLLQTIIASHPDVAAVPETSFLRRYVFNPNARLFDALNDKKIQRVVGLHGYIKDTSIDSEQVNNSFLMAYNRMLEKVGNNNVLDKDPRLVEYISLLLRTFPSCKIIHIYRDPRDVLSSKMKADWSRGRSLLSYLITSRVQLEDGLNAEKSHSVHSIKYEDLIKNTKAEVESVCDFLDFKFAASMLDHTKIASELVSESEMQWKKEVLEPIDSQNSGKWKEDLNNIEALSSMYTVKKLPKISEYSYVKENYSALEVIISYSISRVAVCGAKIYKILRYIRTLHLKKKLL